MDSKFMRTPQWLSESLGEEKLRIIDIRGHVISASEPPPHYFSHRQDYDVSHIPGAVFIDWTTDIVDPNSVAKNVTDAASFSELMGSLGIGSEHTIAIYDDANGMFAARMWWVLRYYGHEAAYVIDGGWQHWVAAGLPTTAEVPTYPPAEFRTKTNENVRAEMQGILGKLNSDALLVDVRSAAEFNGEASRSKRFGHIPGALHLPRKQIVEADGTLKSTADLQKEFHAAGLTDPNAEIIVYCNGGVSASYSMIALLSAGFTNVSMYDGSWNEWGNDPTTPIET